MEIKNMWFKVRDSIAFVIYEKQGLKFILLLLLLLLY